MNTLKSTHIIHYFYGVNDLKKRLENLLQGLALEKQSEMDAYKKVTHQSSIQDRIKLNQTLYPVGYLNVKFTQFGDGLIEFSVNENQMTTSFSNGTLVEVFNAENEKENGVVYSVSDDVLVIQMNVITVQDWIKKGKIGVNKLPDSKTYDLYINELKSIQNTDFPYQIKQIYNENRLIIKSSQAITIPNFNTSQNNAVSEILNTDNKVTVIHGPPGTGKTTTLVGAIQQLTQQKNKIIICAPTNAAVDNICQKFLEQDVKCCRIGNPLKIDSNLHDYTLDGLATQDSAFKLVEQLKKQSEVIRKKAFKFKRNFGKEEFQERKRLKQDLKSLRKDIRKIQKDIYANVLDKADVICGTFIGVLTENFKSIEFDYLIIDEAGQAIEPAVWSVCKLAPHLVLAGDQFQLPPFVQSQKAIQLGLNQTVLNAAQNNHYPTQLLTVQYRMNNKIMGFSNDFFYKSKLIADETVTHWKIKNDEYEPIEFIDTAGCGFEEVKNEFSGGISNPEEFNILKKRLENLDFSTSSIGIISPYRQQIKLIESQLQSDINTIDSFQGQERDIIVISLVRCNSQSEIGFLKDYRRMNVAMTRAKKKLIIIGDSTTIGQDLFYAKILAYVELNGSYRSAWELM